MNGSDGSDGVDEINKVFAEVLSDRSEIIGYECRDCGQQFSSGRDGRKHMFSEHDGPMGLDALREGDQ